jgi:hypothetical protein
MYLLKTDDLQKSTDLSKFCHYSALIYKVVLILLDTDVMAVIAAKHVIMKQSFLEIINDSTMLQDQQQGMTVNITVCQCRATV